MSQSINTHFICVDPSDPFSIRQALEKYTQLIESGRAFRHTYCKYSFKFTHTPDWAEYPDQALIRALLEEGIDTPAYEQGVALDEVFVSETLLVLYAVQFPQLFHTLEALGKAMRDRGRLMNNWYHLFIAQSEFFGFNSLFILAWRYPQLGYLMTGFMPSETKHLLPNIAGLTRAWVKKVGLGEDSIRAWCYCDQPIVRQLMFSDGVALDDDTVYEQPISALYAYVAEDEEVFYRFKGMLNERFFRQAFLPFVEHLDPYEHWGDDTQPRTQADKPVHYFYYSLVARGAMDFDGAAYTFDFPFLNTQVETFADEHARQLALYMNAPLETLIDPWAVRRQGIRYYARDTATIGWEDFIERLLSNGEAVWEYVRKGTNPEVLASIPRIDLYKATRTHYQLAGITRRFEIDSGEAFDANLFGMVNELIDDYLDRQQIPALAIDSVLRFFDVLFRLRGGHPLGDDIKGRLVNDYGVIASEAFDARFRCEIEVKEVNGSLHQLQDLLKEPNIDALNTAYEIICEQRCAAVQWFEEVNRDELRFTFACLVVGREGADPEDFDELYELCQTFIDDEVLDAILDEVKGTISTNYLKGENLALCEQRWEQFVSFIKRGCDSPGTSATEVNLKPFLSPLTSFNWQREIQFEGAFEFDDEYYLLSALWQLLELPLPCAPALQRVLDYLIESEPRHLVAALNAFYFACPYEDEDDEEDVWLNSDTEEDQQALQEKETQLLALMARFGIPAAHYYAWVIDKRQARWHYFAQYYGHPDYTALSLALEEGINTLNQYDRVRFYMEAHTYAKENGKEHAEDTPVAGQEQLSYTTQALQREGFWMLENWLRRGLATPEKRLYASLSAEQQIAYQCSASDIAQSAQAYHDFMGALTLTTSLHDMHTRLIGEGSYLRHDCFMVQRVEGEQYKVLTKPWLVEAMCTSSPLVNKQEGFHPAIYVVDEATDPQAIAEMQHAIEAGVFNRQVAEVIAYIRGEKSREDIKSHLEHAEFVALDYLPEYGEKYALLELMPYFTDAQTERVATLINPDINPGILARFKRLLRR